MHITYLPHLITFLMCSMVAFLAITNIAAYRQVKGARVGQLVIWVSFFQLAVVALFCYNQSLWLINNHEELVGTEISILWLSYDYGNTTFHLLVAATIRSIR